MSSSAASIALPFYSSCSILPGRTRSLLSRLARCRRSSTRHPPFLIWMESPRPTPPESRPPFSVRSPSLYISAHPQLTLVTSIHNHGPFIFVEIKAKASHFFVKQLSFVRGRFGGDKKNSSSTYLRSHSRSNTTGANDGPKPFMSQPMLTLPPNPAFTRNSDVDGSFRSISTSSSPRTSEADRSPNRPVAQSQSIHPSHPHPYRRETSLPPAKGHRKAMSTPLNPMSFMQSRPAENTAPHNAAPLPTPLRPEVGLTSGQASSSSSSGMFSTLFLSHHRSVFRNLCLHPATNGMLGNSPRRVPALAFAGVRVSFPTALLGNETKRNETLRCAQSFCSHSQPRSPRTSHMPCV